MLQIQPKNIVSRRELWQSSSHNAGLELLISTPPPHRCEVCVIVPVRNEASTLTQTLQALAEQVDLRGRPLARDRYEIILLANNCSDPSADIARRFAAANPTLALHIVELKLSKSEANIGKVRQLLMNEALRRLLRSGQGRRIIASTDGDSCVAPNWIAATLQEFEHGVDAVGGRILTNRGDRLKLDPMARYYHLQDVGYKYLIAELETHLDPNSHDSRPRHFQHYGASLAVTAMMYEQVGGLPAVETSEDVALYRALMRHDARFRHSPTVRVYTSARMIGRADGGLAAQLSEWARGESYLVESASSIEKRLRSKGELRSLWRQGSVGLDGREMERVGDCLGVSTSWLQDQLQRPQPFGLLWEKAEKIQQFPIQKVEIEQAIYALRLRLKALE